MDPQPPTQPATPAPRPAAADPATAQSLFPLVYEQLREIARIYIARERGDHTLQPTALVHEAYLKLADQNRVQWQGRTHFMAVAATAMRRILVNHAKAHNALKRGGNLARLALDEALTEAQERSGDLVALDQALCELETIDPEQVRIVELRFFGGLTAREAGEVLEISERTVFRQWLMARAWLRARLVERSTP